MISVAVLRMLLAISDLSAKALQNTMCFLTAGKLVPDPRSKSNYRVSLAVRMAMTLLPTI